MSTKNCWQHKGFSAAQKGQTAFIVRTMYIAKVKKDLTPQFVNCDLADNKYSGIIREELRFCNVRTLMFDVRCDL